IGRWEVHALAGEAAHDRVDEGLGHAFTDADVANHGLKDPRAQLLFRFSRLAPHSDHPSFASKPRARGRVPRESFRRAGAGTARDGVSRESSFAAARSRLASTCASRTS